jgi:hypothetical protein
MYINIENKILADIKLFQINLNSYSSSFRYKILGYSILDNKWIDVINIWDKIENLDYCEKLITEAYNLLLIEFNKIEIIKTENSIILTSNILKQAEINISNISINIVDENIKDDSFEL